MAPQVLKVLKVCKNNGIGGFEVLKSLTKMLKGIANNKVPENIRTFFFEAKIIALVKKDGGLRPIAKGDILRRVVAKCAGSKEISHERQEYFGKPTPDVALAKKQRSRLISSETFLRKRILKRFFA